MIRIGIISDRRHVVNDLGMEWVCESFTISPTAVSFREIFHSAFATPARYVAEIYVRLRIAGADKRESLLVFNPLYQLGNAEIWLVLAEVLAHPQSNSITIFADRAGHPLCYALPPSLNSDDTPYLSMLSTVDAALDTELCSRLFPCGARCLTITNVNASKAQHNGFIYAENLPIYRWIATHALAMVGTEDTATVRRSIPFTAIMPHHAGDVLFFTLAWLLSPTRVSGVAVNQAYQAIVSDNAAKLQRLPLKIPLINRSPEFRLGKVTSEGEYFTTIASALPSGHFYLYQRPSRDYNLSRFHLIDHFAFALGRHLWSADDLLVGHRPLPAVPQQISLSDERVRILLFFDGGWTLKIYPPPAQQQLITHLHRRGYAITVLSGDNQKYQHCTSVRFESYPQLKKLLQTQHLMVGMDSFPTHLAAHILGLPTICLFGSTRPENSNAPRSTHYRHMENGMSCRPCYGIVRCPLYGGNDCANFVAPETVAHAIEDMLRDIQSAPLPPAKTTTQFVESQPQPCSDTRPPHHINLAHRAGKAPLYALIVRLTPAFSLLHQIREEFMVSLKRDGWRQTYLRSLRFLQRTFWPRLKN